jgi:L-ascorbate metabolism protein UlaG (beta-lactamase superfamily)
MSPVHMSPEEALQAHRILGAQASIAIHHGTFQLADDGIDTPSRKLIAGRQDENFSILKNGQFTDIPA